MSAESNECPWRDAETLRELHLERKLVADEMADELGCTKGTVLEWCDRHDIEYDRNRAKPWFNAERLRELYYGQGLSTSEVAEHFDCSPTAIRNTMEKLGIERREALQEASKGSPWRDADRLRELYHGERMRIETIADRFDCTPKTVRLWMRRLDVEKRPEVYERRRGMRMNPAPFETRKDGYERWTTSINRETHIVYVHRLLAVAKYGFDAVADMDVHHENAVPWDNRPENITLLQKEDHGQHHAEERWERA